MKVYKYALNPAALIVINLPKGAKPLYASQQHGKNIYLWALVDPDAPLEKRYFRIIVTGYEIAEPPERLKFINTFFKNDGDYVFHLFEVIL